VSARTKRLERLVRVEHDRVAAKERELGEARSALAAADAATARAAGALEMGLARWADAETAADLADVSAHRESLRLRLAAARADAEAARREVASREKALVAARVSERRIEVLIETAQRNEAAREARLERRAADERAARGRPVP